MIGLAFKTGESALLGLVWRNILRAAYPKSKLPFKIAWGASQGGTAINALVPAQGGTAAMIGIFRTSIAGSSVAGISSLWAFGFTQMKQLFSKYGGSSRRRSPARR